MRTNAPFAALMFAENVANPLRVSNHPSGPLSFWFPGSLKATVLTGTQVVVSAVLTSRMNST
jgi:hypothetical protein